MVRGLENNLSPQQQKLQVEQRDRIVEESGSDLHGWSSEVTAPCWLRPSSRGPEPPEPQSKEAGNYCSCTGPWGALGLPFTGHLSGVRCR